VLHIVEDELSARFPADRGITRRKEFESHRSERAAASGKAGL